MRSHGYLAFLILLFFQTVLFGQNIKQAIVKRCPVKTLNFEQGLTNIAIHDVASDERGFTWFATKTGIQRYNGYVLETINPIVGSDTIQINYPTYFLVNKGNSFLIGYKKGILKFNAEKNSFEKIVSLKADIQLSSSILPITQTPEGIWCLQAGKGIVLYREKQQEPKLFPFSQVKWVDSSFHSTELLLHFKKVLAVNNQYIFIGMYSRQIMQINTSTHESHFLTSNMGAFDEMVCNNTNIFLSSTQGITSLRIADGAIIHQSLYKKITNLPIGFSGIELSADNHLIVSAEKQLFEFDTTCVYKDEIDDINGERIVNTGIVPFIYEDKFKRIWVLTLNEIKRIEDTPVPFEHIRYITEKNNFVRTIYLDEEKHLLIAGCFNGGIQLYDSSGTPLWDHPLISKEVNNVIGIEKISPKSYLIFSSSIIKALYLLDIDRKRLRKIDLGNTACAILQNQIQSIVYANSLQKVDDSSILLSTHWNVFKCIFRKDQMVSARPLLPTDNSNIISLSTFYYSSDKSLWVGSETGTLFKLDKNGSLNTFNIPGDFFVRCIKEDASHHIWVGTDKGIYIFTSSGNLWRQVTKETGLLNDLVYALLPIDKGDRFFASSNLGLSYIAEDGRVNNFTKELGLQENEFNTQSCAKSSTNKLFFGGVNGITAFYPSILLGISKDTPFINITRLVVNDSLYNMFAGAWNSDTILLAHDQNHLQFDIAASGLLNPNEYLYHYRMGGFEKSWQTTHLPTAIRYTLSPGTYLLEINCSPLLFSNSVFTKKIWIHIKAPWWQTWWFMISSFLVLVVSVAMIVMQYNRAKYKKKIADLQLKSEIQNERERISKELHDNIGTQLSYISSNADWMLDSPISLNSVDERKRLAEINNTAKEMIADLRETIWAMKKESVQFDELADKLKLFIQSRQVLRPNLEVVITEHIEENIEFSPTEALHIFRVCQEAIANSIKHAEASRLSLEIRSYPEGGFSIMIEDNGKGFDPLSKYQGHYGLENMQQRATELGTLFSIITEKEKGTKIILEKVVSESHKLRK